jgi:hypothetical protein
MLWPQSGSGKFFRQVFDDGERFPDVNIAVYEGRYLPVPLKGASRVLKSGVSSEITVSSNVIPATFMANHGRNDHEE